MSEKCQESDQIVLYAFWKHESIPYYLGGRIIEFKDRGRLAIHGYEGITIKPVAILSGQAGKNALQRLHDLERAYRSELEQLQLTYKHTAEDILNL